MNHGEGAVIGVQNPVVTSEPRPRDSDFEFAGLGWVRGKADAFGRVYLGASQASVHHADSVGPGALGINRVVTSSAFLKGGPVVTKDFIPFPEVPRGVEVRFHLHSGARTPREHLGMTAGSGR